MQDALSNTAHFGYFGGDLVTVTDPLGNMSTQSVDAVGRVISASDALGNAAKYQYSNLNLLTQVTDAQGHNTSFSYDANGNLLSLTDAAGHTTSYTYDNMDRALTRTDPLNRQESFAYDANGNLASGTDRKTQVTAFTYDGLNRTTLAGFGAVVSGGTTTYQSTIAYTYDAGNRMTQAVDSAGGTITGVYDGLDRMTSETTSLGTITYGYDAASRQTTMQVAGQPQVSYTYDNANRLTQIAQSTSTTGFSYDNANRRTSLTLPNGVSVSYTYDSNSELTGLTYQFGGSSLGNLTYTYDVLGRRTQVGGSFARTGLPGAVSSTTYDAANQLTNWNGTSISYDANGNMLSDGSNAFTWNARNQVETLNGLTLQYDALGRRTKNAVGTSFLYNGTNAIQELSGSTVTANLLSGGVDEVFTRSDSSGSFAPLKDALGSTIALVDSSGTVQTTYSYDPFGSTNASGASNANEFQYTGRENEGNGLYFYRARYYSPLLGRFISEDPLGFAGGINLYRYALNNPLLYRDPSGLLNDETGRRNDELTPGECERGENIFCVHSPAEIQQMRAERARLQQEMDELTPTFQPPTEIFSGRYSGGGQPHNGESRPHRSRDGFEQLAPLMEGQEGIEVIVTNRIIIPLAMVGTGLAVTYVGVEATIGVCATVYGCVLAPVTIGVAVGGLALAGEGIYYGIHQKIYNPF